MKECTWVTRRTKGAIIYLCNDNNWRQLRAILRLLLWLSGPTEIHPKTTWMSKTSSAKIFISILYVSSDFTCYFYV